VEGEPVTEHDVLVGFRLRLFTPAEELGNVSAACRAMGVDRSTYYRWKHRVDRWGLEALAVRERRRPRMANQIGPHLEQKIIAFALGHPALGPRRISAEPAREKWGRDPHLRARRLAGALPRGAEHPRQAPGADRAAPRPL
jgi:Winged helix-turn helix